MPKTRIDPTLKLILDVLNEKQGEAIEAVDVSAITPLTEYYVIATANNPRKLNALQDAVCEALEKAKMAINHTEGTAESGWILIDAYHVVVHLFSEEERERINLDGFVLNRKEVKRL